MFENILYATDFSESPFMLPCVGIIGKTKKIHLLHVIDEQNHIDPALFEPRMHEARDFLDEELNIERNRGISTDVHLLPGVAGREICSIAEKLDASLIVVNYHKPGGPAGSATMELIRNCRRDLLVMTLLSSKAVDQSKMAMEAYCTNLFRRVLCPVTGDPAAKLEALRSLTEEASIGSVTFLCFSDNVDPISLADSLNGIGLKGGVIMAEGTPRKEIVAAAEKTDASIIMLDAGAEMGMALSIVADSEFPALVLKHP
ncbi:MAG TPA: universal stress protein [Methanocella sp.]|uniref:universal stress protein n=1 Tax=Methanocella sp. TaxID=2052833 RepID=UPI002CF65835|nr:universal stress protein [Methanocella sp.]HTY91032.1 universal stress protein [Methanocella sp.]